MKCVSQVTPHAGARPRCDLVVGPRSPVATFVERRIGRVESVAPEATSGKVMPAYWTVRLVQPPDAEKSTHFTHAHDGCLQTLRRFAIVVGFGARVCAVGERLAGFRESSGLIGETLRTRIGPAWKRTKQTALSHADGE